MTLYEDSVRHLCHLAFADDDELQREVQEMVTDASKAGRRSQLRELGSLVALSLRQAGTRTTSTQHGWTRSAASLAAPAAFYVTAASLAATLGSADHLGWLGVAILASAGVASAGGKRLLTLVAAAGAILAVAPSSDLGTIVAIFISIATCLAAPGKAAGVNGRKLPFLYGLLGFVVALALLAGLPVLNLGAVRIATILVASVLILLGWFDPRYALVAAALFACRFATFDLAGLAQAVERLSSGLVVDQLVVRSLLMTVGLVASLVTARHSIARTSTI